MATNVDRYLEQFLSSIPGGKQRPVRFLGSVLWAREADGLPVPMPGDLSIVTLGGDDPVCVIETTETRVIPFDEVTADYAWDGGEGDRSLTSWRELYWEFIERECQRLAREPDAKTPLLMERFRVVYTQPLDR